MINNDTNFGYEKVSPREKTRRVNKVFSSVADEYNLMNDIMSFGIHKLWKRFAVNLCSIRKDFHVLDLACGTGDITKLVYEKLGKYGHVTLCDINETMLNHGRDNLINKGIIKNIDYIRANAESLPFKDNSFDCVIIAFGLRNITDKNAALKSIYKKLKYGTQLVILEFSKVTIPFIDKLYLKYLFKFIPKFGKAVAKDEDSYRYLVESIRVHPDQKLLASMIEEAGFKNIKFHNLSAGIVAVHRGYKI
jgi:demethylmenaquinone methyltransferase/2-methoxy-6-polyprenyl-1,4-benzoquinol methylase